MEKKWHGSQHGNFFARGVLWRSSLCDNLKPANKKLGLRRLATRGHFWIVLSILSAIPTIASNTLVLTWYSWPTSAFLHHNLKRSLDHAYNSMAFWSMHNPPFTRKEPERRTSDEPPLENSRREWPHAHRKRNQKRSKVGSYDYT